MAVCGVLIYQLYVHVVADGADVGAFNTIEFVLSVFKLVYYSLPIASGYWTNAIGPVVARTPPALPVTFGSGPI